MADNAILIGKAVTSADSLPETHGQVFLQGKLGNRHGLVAGATGTGKTVTLMTIAEGFSRIGVPLATTRLFIWYVPVYRAARPGAHGAAWA